MVVISLLSGPGKGKSTLASGLFCRMKMEGYNVELVTEYAKDLVWSKRFAELDNQMYVTAKQFHRQYILKDKVDWIVTDSPILLGAVYNKMNLKHLEPLVLELFNQFDNMNFFITKNEGRYSKIGRMQDREESDAITKVLLQFLDKHDIKHIDVEVNLNFDKVIEYMFQKVKERK